MRALHTAYATLMMYTVHYAWTAACTLACLPFALAGWRAGAAVVARAWGLGLFWVLLRRVRVEGRAHIEPGRRYIIALNHTSLYDIPALMTLFPRVAWLGRAHLLDVPVFGFVLRRIDYVPVYPGEPARSREALAYAAAKSPHASIAIFPEGTRTRDGRVGPFRKGLAQLVRDTDLDVLPITVHGLFHWRPKHRRVLTPHAPVRLVVHPPIPNAELRALDTDALLARVRDAVAAGLPAAPSDGPAQLDGPPPSR